LTKNLDKNKSDCRELESPNMTLRRRGREIMVTNDIENRKRSSDINSIGFLGVSPEDSDQYIYIFEVRFEDCCVSPVCELLGSSGLNMSKLLGYTQHDTILVTFELFEC